MNVLSCLRRLVLAVAPSAAILAAGAPAAPAQGNCGPPAEVAAALAGKYGEVRLFAGSLRSGNRVEIWANPAGTTWTALEERADGAVTCIRASGEGWQAAPEAPPAGEEG